MKDKQKLIDYIYEFSFEFGRLWNTTLTYRQKMKRVGERIKLPEEFVDEYFNNEEK